jgi:hypothetical protein
LEKNIIHSTFAPRKSAYTLIGMVKEMKQRYLVQGKRLTLREVFQSLPASTAKDIKGSVIVQTAGHFKYGCDAGRR